MALATFIVSVIWRLPEEGAFIGHRVGELAVTLVLAMSATYVLRPIVRYLMRFRFFNRVSGGRSWATLLVFVLCGLLVYLVCTLGFRSISRDISSLWHSFIPSDPAEKMALFQKWRDTFTQSAAPYLKMLPPDVQMQIKNAFASSVSSTMPAFTLWLKNSFSHAGFIVELLLLPVLVFYFLADGGAIRREMSLLLPLQWRPAAGRMVAHLDRVLDSYIRGQMVMCLIAWVFVSLLLWALGVPHAFTLGFVAGLTRAIPVIGPLIGGIPIALVCLLTTRSFPLMLTVIGGFAIMHFVESKVLLPKIIGHEVDLHPVSVIIALLLGLEFFGFMGVFLAVPVAALLKIVLVEWHANQEAKLAAQHIISNAENETLSANDAISSTRLEQGTPSVSDG